MGDKSKCIFLCDALLSCFVFLFCDRRSDCWWLWSVCRNFYVVCSSFVALRFLEDVDSFYSFLFLLHFLVGFLRTFVLDLRCTKKSYRVIFSCGGRWLFLNARGSEVWPASSSNWPSVEVVGRIDLFIYFIYPNWSIIFWKSKFIMTS
jgi:hypothetical protein